MKSTLIKLLAVMLVVVMMIPLMAACKTDKGGEDTTGSTEDTTPVETAEDIDAVSNKTAPQVSIPTYTGGDTLVVGYDIFSQKFSPFFAKTGYDQDVASMTQVSLLEVDREGNIVLLGKTGETRAFNGKSYDYKGIADCKITQNQDGTVVYEFTLRDNVYFSDGVNLTADDVIFSMYVLCDPTYTGSSSFYTLPIEGMEAYRSGMKVLSSLILEKGRDNADFSLFSKEAADKYWAAVDAAGKDFAQEIVDYVFAEYGSADYVTSGYGGKWGAAITAGSNYAVAYGMRMWGFGSWVKNNAGEYTGEFKDKNGKIYDCVTTFPTISDYWNNLYTAYNGDLATLSDTESAGSDLFTMIDEKLGADAAKYAVGVVTGESAPNITGIEKTGMYSLKITMKEFDATAIYNLGISVSPLHYYGSRSNYKYSENKFGFVKGDLSTVKAKTTTPMGAGAYKFISYANGIVTFERNIYFYKGCPKITYIKFQEITDNADKVASIVTGTIDISDPSLTSGIINAIKTANTNGALTGNTITYNAVDNRGYGYIGINANLVKVGDDKASTASKNLRKAFATLFAVYRDTVIKSYYGDRANVIQYPISNTSWAAPRPADAGYSIAYSKDVNGNSIYTSSMTEEQKYAAALNAAIGFLKAAGYTWDDSAKKFTAAPAGASMTYEVIIPASGKGDHPAYGILTSTKTALSNIGITLNINDPSDSNVLWTSLEAGTCAMWAAAWQSTPDPDMYQVYHSSNIVGQGGTDSNHYAITDSQLDELIMAARKSADTAYRKATYKQCLEIILDWAVEIPTYQRQNCVIFSTARVKISTLTPDITTFWGWANDIELLEMN
jgi:peptide/nickel transport system substrate-binding protein